MLSAIPAALENGELFALFQPQVTVDRRRVVGAEALLRWNRPGEGLVPPDAFVPFAESHGLIERIGGFMLDRAMREAAPWGAMRIAINVSPLQFSRIDLVTTICDLALEASLPLDRLELEITETATFPNFELAREQLLRFRELGVTLTLDDLGSGEATLGLMELLPLHRVKLPKSLVDHVGGDYGSRKLRFVVEQAHKLGLGITAEGVESEAQIALLRRYGCDLLQGYIFARPLTAQDFPVFADGYNRENANRS